MLAALLLSFRPDADPYPPEIRKIADVSVAFAPGGNASGVAAFSDLAGFPGTRMLVVSPQGRMTLRRSLPKGTALRGVDARGRPVLTRVPAGPSGWWTESLLPETFGDVVVSQKAGPDGATGVRLTGRVAGEIPNPYGNIVPLIDRPEAIGWEGRELVRYSGPGLARRTVVPLTLDDAREPVALNRYLHDLSLASLGNDEVALFVDSADVIPRTRFLLPRLGNRIIVNYYETEEKTLVVASLKTGICQVVVRFEVPYLGYAREFLYRSLVFNGRDRVLVVHDDTIFRIDVGRRRRYPPPD